MLEGRVGEERAEAFAYQALEDVGVPVEVRAERRRAVVDVQRPEPVEADGRVDLLHERVDRGGAVTS